MTEKRELLLSVADSMEKLALGLRALAAEADGEKKEEVKKDAAANPIEAEKEKEAAQPQEKKYTMTDVRKKLAALSDAGKTAEIKAMLGRYGAAKLSLIKPEDYVAVMAEAEEMEKEVKVQSGEMEKEVKAKAGEGDKEGGA